MTSDSEDKTDQETPPVEPEDIGGRQTAAGAAEAPGLLQARDSLPPRAQPANGRTAAARRAVVADEVVTAGPARGTFAGPARGAYAIPAAPAEDGLFKNPYVLAGLAVAAAILLAVMVVFLFGSGDGAGSNPGGGQGVDPLTPLPGRGVTARSIATANVREGPNIEYLEIGLLRSGQDVEVVGRNPEATWFQIYYPPRSQLRGWVPGSALRIPEGNEEGIAVVAVTPIPRPTVIQPTPAPLPTETATPVASTTGTPGATGPDLAVAILGNNCEPGLPLVVMVSNVSATSTSGQEMRLVVSNPAGVLAVLGLPPLEAGASFPVQTNVVVQPPRITVRVDLLGAPADARQGNNEVDCAVRGSGPGGQATPTRTPRNRD